MRRLIVFLCLIMALAMLPSVEGAPHRGTLTVDSIKARSGLVEHRNATFSVAWTASTGTAVYDEDNYETAYTGLNYWSENYMVQRLFYTFDTGDLKKNYRVESANLQIFCMGVQYNLTWTVKIQKWTDTDDSLTVDDFTAFDGVSYDDDSMQREDLETGEWNNIPIRDDNLLVKKGETKLCLRISKEIEGYESQSWIQLGVSSGAKLEINYVWATGSQAQPKSINFIPFVIGAIAICGGISFVALKRDKARRLYS